LRAWKEEEDHGERPGPFAGIPLTGADVFWLATQSLAAQRLARALVKADPSVAFLPSGDIPLEPESSESTEPFIARAASDLATPVREKGGLSVTQPLRSGRGATPSLGPTTQELELSGVILHLQLAGAVLAGAHLEDATLGGVHFEQADLRGAHLEGAYLRGAHLEGTDLRDAYLQQAVLRLAACNRTTRLNGAHFNQTTVDQINFDNTNLAVIDWREVIELGDEMEARRARGA
jgi:hypothetical protein